MDRFPMSEKNYRKDYRLAIENMFLDVSFLEGAGYDFLTIPQEVRNVYFNDLVIVNLLNDGCKEFAHRSADWHPYTRQGMLLGLGRIAAKQTAKLVDRIYRADASAFEQDCDAVVRKTAEDEAVERLNEELLWTTDKIAWKADDEVQAEIGDLVLAAMQTGKSGER